jgi:fructosamine-3-kinase
VMHLPAALHEAIVEAFGGSPLRIEPVSGGMINQAARLEMPDGCVFLKWKTDAPHGFFAAEADGLDRLRRAGALRVPQVLALQERSETASDNPSFLALEYIEPMRTPHQADFANRFGRRLANLHRDTSSVGYGLERDNFIGSLPQQNAWRCTWPDFYRDCRILPQVEIARKLGRLNSSREIGIMRVIENIDQLLTGIDERPSLLHGDLWSGNYLAVDDEPVVIDPAVYYGCREVELAFTELFGGFPEGFVHAYNSEYPLDAGYDFRRPLHQLYPLLVHLNHFGDSYGPDVDAVCAHYV